MPLEATSNALCYGTLMGANMLEKIIEGVGVGGIEVGVSSASDVVAAYGKLPRRVEHWSPESHLRERSRYSTELIYDSLGLSFFLRADDPRERVFYLQVRPPFLGLTTRGAILGRTTMAEAVALYGPPAWRTSQGASTWHSAYPGIELHVMKDTSVPEFPLDEALHLPRVIIAMGVSRGA